VSIVITHTAFISTKGNLVSLSLSYSIQYVYTLLLVHYVHIPAHIHSFHNYSFHYSKFITQIPSITFTHYSIQLIYVHTPLVIHLHHIIHPIIPSSRTRPFISLSSFHIHIHPARSLYPFHLIHDPFPYSPLAVAAL
jgi:hypothetical protein